MFIFVMNVLTFVLRLLKKNLNSMQRMTDVPYSVVDVVQGLIIIFVVAKVIFKFRRPSWFRRAGARKEAAKNAQ